MAERRLVGIDLGIASMHTVRVLREDGSEVCRRRCQPTRESLLEIEEASLRGTEPGVRLEVVMEPTGPAWLPVAVFFVNRGHLVYRASSAQSADLRRFFSRHAKSNGIDAETLARLPLLAPQAMHALRLPTAAQASLDRRVRVSDRLVQQISRSKVRIKALVRELLPMTPLSEDLSKADLAVLEKTGAEPHRLVALGRGRLTGLIQNSSQGHAGLTRAQAWLDAARLALELYQDHPGVASEDRAAEVMTEVALLHSFEAQLAIHRPLREAAYRRVDPEQLVRSLPAVAEVGAPTLTVFVAEASRFPNGHHFRSFTGLAPRASETGDSDRKGQVMSKAGPRLLRTGLVRAANGARQQDPQLARIYYVQMVERGASHQKALCVVAAHLAERLWRVVRRQTPYELRDTDGRPITKAEGMAIASTRWKVPEEVRRRRRSKKTRKAPQQFPTGNAKSSAQGANTRRPSSPTILAAAAIASNPGYLRTNVSA
jgi:transposase